MNWKLQTGRYDLIILHIYKYIFFRIQYNFFEQLQTTAYKTISFESESNGCFCKSVSMYPNFKINLEGKTLSRLLLFLSIETREVHMTFQLQMFDKVQWWWLRWTMCAWKPTAYIMIELWKSLMESCGFVYCTVLNSNFSLPLPQTLKTCLRVNNEKNRLKYLL